MFSFPKLRLFSLLFVLTIFILILLEGQPVQAEFIRNEDRYWNMGDRPLPGDGNGEIKHCTLESNNLKTPNNIVGLNVYTPPDYNNNSLEYPVIYLLHGLNGNEYNYLSYYSNSDFFSSSSGSLPSLVDNGLAEEAIIVVVNGGAQSFYNDWSDDTTYGPSSDFPILSESVIMEDVIPFVDANFRTIASRNGRAIEGFSMGGRGAIKLAFNYPDQFCSAIAYAGAAYESIPGSAVGNPYIGPHEPANQMSTIAEVNAAIILANGLQIRLVDGINDGAAGQGGGSDALSIQLNELGIPHEFEPSQSGVSSHNWAQYHQATGAYGLDFHFQCFNGSVATSTFSTSTAVSTVVIEETINREPWPTKPPNPRLTATLPPTSTSAQLPTATSTSSPTSTNTSTSPPTSTSTLPPTATSTQPPTSTSTTATSTLPPTSTSTLPPTTTLTLPPTSTSTLPPTATSTLPPTSTSTLTPTITFTPFPTLTATLTPTSSATLLPTLTSIPQQTPVVIGSCN